MKSILENRCTWFDNSSEKRPLVFQQAVFVMVIAMNTLFKFFTGFYVFTLLAYGISFISVIFILTVLVGVCAIYPAFISRIEIVLFRESITNKVLSEKGKFILLCFCQVVLFILSLFYIEKIETVKEFLFLLVIYSFLILAYMLNILKYNDKNIENIFNQLLYPTIVVLGYYFYLMIPNDILRITNLGYQNFSDFYLIIIAFSYFFILFFIALSIILPLLLLFFKIVFILKERYYFSKVTKKVKIKKTTWLMIGFICLFTVLNACTLNLNLNKINSDDFIANALVYVFYLDDLPTSCDNSEFYLPQDKFMFIDKDTLSVAYKKGKSYVFFLENCREVER